MHASRRPAPLLALAFAVLAASAHADAPPPDRGELKVVALEGEVTVLDKGAAGAPHAVALQAIVHEGDVVITGDSGRVELLINTGTRLRIGPASRAELREAPREGGRFRLKLAVGNLWAHVAKLLSGDRFEVETENGVAGVRGTEFTVDAAGDTGDDSLRVFEGAVQCDHLSGKWSKRVEPGKELLFHRERPTTLRAFDVSAAHALRDWRPVGRQEKAAPGKDGGKKDKDDKREDKKEKRSLKDRVKGFLRRD
jgi:ferric-dicitrate binding protein FerR (iron transport regulator)